MVIERDFYLRFYEVFHDRFLKREINKPEWENYNKISSKVWANAREEGAKKPKVCSFFSGWKGDIAVQQFYKWYLVFKLRNGKPRVDSFEIDDDLIMIKALIYIGLGKKTKANNFKLDLDFDVLQNNQNWASINNDTVRDFLIEEFRKKYMQLQILKQTTALVSSSEPIEELISDNLSNDNTFDYNEREDLSEETLKEIGYQTDKNLGTKFVEIELPLIISRMPESPSSRPNGIIFLDIDDLTIINKKFGREVGDIVLDEIETIIKRRSIFKHSGRCGDDTFYGVLYYAESDRILDTCHKIKKDISRHEWRAIEDNLRVTCTIGWAEKQKDESPYSWLERAIRGMLRGKEKRGNLVEAGPLFLKKNQIIENFSLRDFFS